MIFLSETDRNEYYCSLFYSIVLLCNVLKITKNVDSIRLLKLHNKQIYYYKKGNRWEKLMKDNKDE